jgi:uncharacterized low-complexity protein
MKNPTKKPIITALGAAFVTSMAFTPVVNADANPFGATELKTGYMMLAEGKCGEGKCGTEKAADKAKEAKCGEGKCGAEKAADKVKEAKCGEGKCGAEKAANKVKEGKCGSKK